MPRKLPFLIAISMVIATLPLAAQAALTHHWVHYKWMQNNPTLPRKVVVLPVDVEVVEVTAGGVEEEVPDWSKEASRGVFKALSAAIGKQGLKENAAPKFTVISAANVDEHLALYKLVVGTASQIDWKHKAKRFDYSLGPGLRELADKTGADVAFMVYGRDYTSTAGRKARAVAANIPIVGAFTGAAPTLGHSYIHVGAVDLKTGDLLWMNSNYREGSTNLRDPNDAAKMMDTIFKLYPGIKEYRKAYVR